MTAWLRLINNPNQPQCKIHFIKNMINILMKFSKYRPLNSHIAIVLNSYVYVNLFIKYAVLYYVGIVEIF